MKRSNRLISSKVWSASCFPLLEPLNTDHRLPQTSGAQKGTAGLVLPELKAGFSNGSEAQSNNQGTYPISGWQAAPRSTGSSYWQMMGWFLQPKYNEQMYPFIPGTVLKRSLRSEVSH